MRTRALPSAISIAALAGAILLTGCGKPKSERKLDQLDAQLLANQSDRALTNSLAEQIVVDPAKAGKAKAETPAKATPAPKPAAASAPAPASATATTTTTTTATSAPAPRFAKVPPPIGPAPTAPATPAPAATASAAPAPAAPPTRTLGELARTQAATKPTATKPAASSPTKVAAKPADVGPVSGECYADLAYGKAWAGKLPAALPLYPGASLQEAAGNEAHGCAVRVVSFAARDPWRKVADWYRKSTQKAGWDADETVRGGAHVVAGTAADGSAFYLTLTPTAGGGTGADMIVSLGH